MEKIVKNDPMIILIDALKIGIEDGTVRRDIDPVKMAIVLWGQTTGVVQNKYRKCKAITEAFDIGRYVSIGLTSLMGIAINNSIILTTATTISGLLPLTLAGGDMWGVMGWTIIGGLLASTILTLIVVPVLYMLSERGKEPA